MPGNNKVSKKELFKRQVAKAVLAHFRGSNGKLVMTGETIVDNLHEALVALGDPDDYRVALDLLNSFGFASETLGLAHFADVKPKLAKVAGAIVHNKLVSVEVNTAAQKAAVLLLLTQNAVDYRKAIVSAKDAAQLLNDALDLSPTPQQTPQQTDDAEKPDDADKADEAAKGDTPMETDVPEETAKGATQTTITEADLGAVLGGDIGKLPPLPEKVHDDVASPQAQRVVPGDDHGATAQAPAQAQAQAPAQAQAQAPTQVHGRGKGTLTPPLKRKANASGGSRKKRNNGFTCTFHKVNKPKESKRAVALRNLKARECDESKNLKMRAVGLVKDNGKTSGLGQRKVEPLFPGYHLLPNQLQGNLLKVETYHNGKSAYGDVLYLPMKVCFSHYPGHSRNPASIYRPHRNIKAAADSPNKWIEAAGENYLYYPTSEEIDAAAQHGEEYRVPKPTITTATSAAESANHQASDDSGSGDDDDQADDSGSGSGDEGSGDEGSGDDE
jgi:hypothetical protein